MLNERVNEAVNAQLNSEVSSSYLYLSMAAYFESEDLEGFAQWMKAQAEEEWMHAMKLYDYLVERGYRVELQAIEKPKASWESPLGAFKDAQKHERKITKKVNEVAEVASEAGDRATENVMDWFIDEQVEEESTIGRVVKRVKLAGDDPSALLMLDAEMGKRTAPPASQAGSGE